MNHTVKTQRIIMGTERNWVRVLLAMIITFVLMAVFNSEALLVWVRGLPAGVIEDKLITGVEVWHGWMTSLGASDFITIAREQVRLLKEATW